MEIIQRDWIQEIEDGKQITSVEMQIYVNRLGTQRYCVFPRESVLIFL